MDTKKLHALISLLDDPDVEIYSTVESVLRNEQIEIVPELERAWEVSVDRVFQERVENIIHSLQFDSLKKALKEWAESGDKDFLYAVFLVAKYQYPELSYSVVLDTIKKIKKDIWMELNGHLTSLEKISIVNHVLFDKYKFSRNSKELLSPKNNYINDVLDSRLGNPVSLSVIYSAVCQGLGMPVYGVNLPKNFILVYLDEDISVENETCQQQKCSAQFYINPINNGAIIGKREIEVFLNQQKVSVLNNYFTPCSNVSVVKRILNNLRFSFDSMGEDDKKNEIIELMGILEG
jgi:regulator of sirC expression with transglutaminase-like and TPR domain